MKSFQIVLSIILVLNYIHSTLGAEFSRKQAGTVTIANGANNSTVTISAIDLSKSFLVFSSTLDNPSPTNYQVGGEITNSTTLTFERTGTVGDVSISWQVFEFESGINVQRGSSPVALGTNVDIAISCVDLSKSFVILSARKSGTQLGNDDGVTGDLTSETNLRLLTGTAGATMEEVYWQVIEYEAAMVKKVTASLTGTTATSDLTVQTGSTVSNLAKTMVISNHRISGNSNPDDMPRTELTSNNIVTYTRVGSANTMDFVTYIIEFTDASSVVRGTQPFTNADVTLPVSITATDASGVFGTGNYGRQGSTSFATNDNTGTVWFTYEITSPVNLQITRAIASSSTAEVPWQIVTFEDTDLQQNTFYSLTSGDWDANTTWSFTSDGSSGAVPSGVYPRRSNNVVIQNGHTVTINNVNDNGPCSQSPEDLGRSNVATFTGSADQMFYHTGDILVSNGGTLNASEEVMIEGYTLVENGGTFSVSEDIVNLGYFEIQTTANFSNTDDLILSGNSITIIDNTSFGADDIYIDYTDATLCGDGIVNLGNGGADPTIQFFNGGTLDQVCSNFTVTCTLNCTGFPFSGTGNFLAGNRGPGGVGNANNNQFWVRAHDLALTNGDAVGTWSDTSGNGLDATQSAPTNQPTFNTNAINSFASLSFDGDDVLNLGDVLNLTPGVDSWSFFSVFNVNTSNTGTLFSRASTTNRQFQYYIDNDNFNFYSGNVAPGGALLGTETATGAWNIGAAITSTSSSDSWVAATNDISGGAVGSNTTTEDVLIGARFFDGGANTTFRLTGEIAEIIFYDVELNESQRIIVDNYLAAKYDIDISASGNDFYTMDNNANGDYDFEVAGIGQASDGSNHRDARGTGIVRMYNPNNLGNSEFLLWGHDNAATLTSTSSTIGVDVDGTVIEERLSRVWRVSESGDVGNVSISFDFSSLGGSPLGSNLRLLIDRDDDFSTNDVTPIVGSVSNNIAVFSGVNFQNGDRFTLGNTDASAPLPIELLEFTAVPQSNTVLLEWTTTTETDNDYFTIERSQDISDWEEIKLVNGAGTSTKTVKYQTRDYNPYTGRTYYRLKQTDYDGQYSYSDLITVDFNNHSPIKIFPNPSAGLFTVMNERVSKENIQLFDAQGRSVEAIIKYQDNTTLVDASTIPDGLYILQIQRGHLSETIRLIKQ